MKLHAFTASLLVLAALLTVCQKSGPADPVAAAGAAPEPAAAATADSAAIASDAPAGAAAPASDAAATPAFGIAAVPVSYAALGEFPSFSLRAGYERMIRPVSISHARLPFFTGRGFTWGPSRPSQPS